MGLIVFAEIRILSLVLAVLGFESMSVSDFNFLAGRTSPAGGASGF